jgi:hypothetical protein
MMKILWITLILILSAVLIGLGYSTVAQIMHFEWAWSIPYGVYNGGVYQPNRAVIGYSLSDFSQTFTYPTTSTPVLADKGEIVYDEH